MPYDSSRTQVFWRQNPGKITTGSPLTGVPNRGGVGYNRRFSTNNSLYLKNSAR